MDKHLPLQGKRILITRAKEQVAAFIEQIEAVGGVPIPAPLIEIKGNHDNEEQIKSTLQNLSRYDCIVFTSANGVDYFKHYLDKWAIPYKNLEHLIAASVGRKTSKQMEKLGLAVSIIPEEFVAEKLAVSISENLKPHSNVLVIRGNLSRPALVNELKNNDFTVTDLIVYKTVHNTAEAEKLELLVKEGELDYITFTSSSSVDSFMRVLNRDELIEGLKNITFICIGPITNNTLQEYGFSGIMPTSYTIEDMVKLMIEHANN